MRKILCESLSIQTSSKAIISGNVAKSLTTLQDEVRIWMTDPSAFVHGATALVVGGEDTIRKKLYAVQFTRRFETADIVTANMLTPRVLIGTSGCIGAGVDSEDITLVAHVGMPTSLMHFIQEMGRHDRMIQNENENAKNTCHHMNDLKEFGSLNERLYFEDDKEN